MAVLTRQLESARVELKGALDRMDQGDEAARKREREIWQRETEARDRDRWERSRGGGIVCLRDGFRLLGINLNFR